MGTTFARAASVVRPGYVLPAVREMSSTAAAALRAAVIGGAATASDLRFPKVIDQGGEAPCCVSCAITGAIEILHPEYPELSPQFHYYVTRRRGGANADGFLYLDQALIALQQAGICARKLHNPVFQSDALAQAPSDAAFADAKTRCLPRAELLPPFGSIVQPWTFLSGGSRAMKMRDAVLRGRPVVVGIELPQRYPTDFLNEEGQWDDPENPPRSGAGHCVLVLGFNDAKQAFRIQDSRGSAIFPNGQWWMGYAVAESTVLAQALTFR